LPPDAGQGISLSRFLPRKVSVLSAPGTIFRLV
jgi:hypothetical protein